MKPGDENRNLGDLRALAAEEELRKIKERSPKLRRAARKAQKAQRPKFSAADLSEVEEAPSEWEEVPTRESRRPRGRGAPRTAASATGERLSTSPAAAADAVGTALDSAPATGPATEALLRGYVSFAAHGICRVLVGTECVSARLPRALAATLSTGLAVGDEVTLESHSGELRVREILPRRTRLSRPDPHDPLREQVLLANVELVVHVVAIADPPLRPRLIDRILVAIARGGARPALCVNKVDLLPGGARKRKQVTELAEIAELEPYRVLGFPVVCTSAASGEGIESLRRILSGKLAALVGHSGVGKSSLLNALDPGLALATRAVGARQGKGRHTTSAATIHQLAGGVLLADTPGVREFGLWDLSARDLAACFPDFVALAGACRFADCLHTSEPDCAVRAAVGTGELAPARYDTYLRLLDSLN